MVGQSLHDRQIGFVHGLDGLSHYVTVQWVSLLVQAYSLQLAVTYACDKICYFLSSKVFGFHAKALQSAFNTFFRRRGSILQHGYTSTWDEVVGLIARPLTE